MTDPAELLDLVLSRAPKLRAAGVLEVAVEGVSIKLAPAELEPARGDDNTDADDAPNSMWEDPDLYGRKSGQALPGIGERRAPRKKRRS